MGTQRPPKSLLNHPPSHTHTQLHRKRHSGRYQVPMGNQHTTLHTMNDTLPLPLHLFLHQSLFEAQHVEDWLHPSLVVVSLWILVVGALEKASSPGSGTPSGSSWLNRELDQSTIQDGAMIQGRSRWEDFVLARIQGGNHGGRWCLALFDLWRWVLFFLLAVILRTSEPLLYRRYYKLPIAVSLILSPPIADFLFSLFSTHHTHSILGIMNDTLYTYISNAIHLLGLSFYSDSFSDAASESNSSATSLPLSSGAKSSSAK